MPRSPVPRRTGRARLSSLLVVALLSLPPTTLADPGAPRAWTAEGSAGEWVIAFIPLPREVCRESSVEVRVAVVASDNGSLLHAIAGPSAVRQEWPTLPTEVRFLTGSASQAFRAASRGQDCAGFALAFASEQPWQLELDIQAAAPEPRNYLEKAWTARGEGALLLTTWNARETFRSIRLQADVGAGWSHLEFASSENDSGSQAEVRTYHLALPGMNPVDAALVRPAARLTVSAPMPVLPGCCKHSAGVGHYSAIGSHAHPAGNAEAVVSSTGTASDLRGYLLHLPVTEPDFPPGFIPMSYTQSTV